MQIQGIEEREGRRFGVGGSGVRRTRLDDVALDAIGETIAATPVDALLGTHQHSRRR